MVLVRSHFGDVVMREPLRYALAVNPPVRVPVALNGFALWNVRRLASDTDEHALSSFAVGLYCLGGKSGPFDRSWSPKAAERN